MTSPPGETRSERTDGPDARTTARGMWETRPARDPNDKVIAGVAAAIARRYDVDPVLVRVVFVVGGFYGVGLLLYFVLWVVLPDRTRPGRTPIVPLVIAVFIGFAVLAGLGDGSSWGLLGLLLAAALLYALHVSRGDLGVASSGRDGAVEGAVGDAAAGGATAALAAPPRPPRSPVAAVTLAGALVVAGLVAVAGLLGWVPLGVTPIVGSALAVVGAGLVAGAFLGSGRWLVLAALPLAFVLVVAALAPPWQGGRFGGFDDDGGGFDRPGTSRGFQNGAWAPGLAADVAPAYRTGVGDARLDLRALPPGPPVSTTVESGVGDVTVLVGPTADVTVDCASGAGEVRCLGRDAVGRVVDLGVDGPGGPAITLRAQSGAGDVEVSRG